MCYNITRQQEKEGKFCMKKLVSEPRKCLLSMLGLVFICETLLNSGYRFLQVLGILIVPFIITLSIVLVTMQQKKTNE